MPSSANDRPKLLKDLTITQLDKIAKEHLNITDLNLKQRKDAIVCQLKQAMELDQDCSVCLGQCDSESHYFNPTAFNVSAPSNPGFAAELAEFLSSRNINVDSPSGNGATQFVQSDAAASASASIQQLLDAAHKQVQAADQAGDVPDTPIIQPESPTNLLFNLLSKQQSQHDSQTKLMETMMNFMTKVTSDSSRPPREVDLTNSTEPTRGKIAVSRSINKEHAQFAGISLQPLCAVEGDLETLDLSKMKTKLKSGEHSSGSLDVLKEVYWPHHCVPKALLGGVTPPYSKLSPNQFYCGLINCILIEIPPEFQNTPHVHMLKFTSLILKMNLTTTWTDVLAHCAEFFRNLEQAQLEWKNWDEIKEWHKSALDGLHAKNFASNQTAFRDRSATMPNISNHQTNQNTNQFDKMFGLEVAWLKSNQICIKFQSGVCTFKTEHNTIKENITLRHICAGCEFLKAPADSSHGAKTCPKKSQFFR